MSSPADHNDAATRRVLRNLELTVDRRLAGVVHGDFRGMFPGPGSESGDSRPYTPGDDVRLIDWNLTARTAVPHVRDPIWDHELDLWIVVDLSPSLHFGTVGGTKTALALLATAAFAYPARRLANRIGAILIDGSRQEIVPGKASAEHLRALLHRVTTFEPAEQPGRTDLGAALGECGRLAKRRGLVVIVSDFLVSDGWQRALAQLAVRHTVIAVQVLDPREIDLPNVGDVALQDPESGRVRVIPTGSQRFRARYAEAARAQQAAIRSEILIHGAEHLLLRTNSDWIGDLYRFFDQRRRARRYGSPCPT